MEVVKISPRGYCHGVVNALNVVKKAIKEHPDKQIYILGIIIHNKFIETALKRKGVISLYAKDKTRLELIEEIDEGVVVFSAHGISTAVINRAKEKGLIYYNATCRDVTKTQDLAKEYLADNYDILYIGKKGHPEAEAFLAINYERIKLIDSLKDLANLNIKAKTMVTNQTTMSIYDTKAIRERILEINPHVIIENEICTATQMRQEALFDLADFDMIYVVGDNLSNNSNNLAKIANKRVDKVKLIESVNDIDGSDLANIKKVGVTAGASTPTQIFNQVIAYLKSYPDIKHFDKTIDYEKLF